MCEVCEVAAYVGDCESACCVVVAALVASSKSAYPVSNREPLREGINRSLYTLLELHC